MASDEESGEQEQFRMCLDCRFCSFMPNPFWCALHQEHNNVARFMPACDDYEAGDRYVPDVEFERLADDTQDAWLSKAEKESRGNPTYQEKPWLIRQLAITMWWNNEGHDAFMKKRMDQKNQKPAAQEGAKDGQR